MTISERTQDASSGTCSLKCVSVLKSYFIKKTKQKSTKIKKSFILGTMYRATISMILIVRAEQILTDS